MNPIEIAFMVVACCISYLLGEWGGRRAGMCSGYGALKFPDSPYFAEARAFINWIRQKDGLPTIEEEAGIADRERVPKDERRGLR